MDIQTWTLLLFCLLLTVAAFPQLSETYVTVGSPNIKFKKREAKESRDLQVIPKIYEMTLATNVTNRFATTLITSKVKNFETTAHEAVFSVIIPDKAYITGFVMKVDGKSYKAYIQEKEEAKNTYQNAVSRGQAAGHVGVSARDSNRFTVSVNIEPQSKATFYLTYEELLKRQDDKYQILLNIHPGQPVEKLEAKVSIAESRPLKFVTVPSIRTGNEVLKSDPQLNPDANIDNINTTAAVVFFNPNIEKQKQYAVELGTKEDYGFAGQFVVEYDVEKDPFGGMVLLNDGYFVHFFAPENLPYLPKQVVFILDTSGSMQGTRIVQLKEAMKSILSELKTDDVFNIVEFKDVAKVWNVEAVAVQHESGVSYWTRSSEDTFKNRTHQPLPPAYPATAENINKAGQVINKLGALGGTDIQVALKIGIKLVAQNLENNKEYQPIIIFLTDGEPTVGETNTETITRTITELNGKRAPIFSLSFGDGADRKFLEKISLKNLGFSKHIYEAADASLQLQKFYKQISSPLLSKITFKYSSDVTDVTKQDFPVLFRGSELVVAGHYDEGFQPKMIECWGRNGTLTLKPKIENAVGNLERLWAYLTLKQILEEREQAENKTEATQRALNIALKYSFVSDVSSLVVVKPNSTNEVETEDGSKKSISYAPLRGGTPQLALASPISGSTNYHSFSASPMSGSTNYHSFSAALAPRGFAPYYSSSASRFATYPAHSGPSGWTATRKNIVSYPKQVHSTADAIVPSTSTRTPADDELNILKSKLPWLTLALDPNYSIKLSKGSYKLGLNEIISTRIECNNSLSNSTGDCVLLHKCPHMLTHLSDKITYEKYFCNLVGFAGICCPKGQTGTTNN